MAIDCTPAGLTADSYLCVAPADAYAAADVGPEVDVWVAATTDQKERALKRATREIDSYLRSGFPKADPAQPLRFPRSIDVDTMGDPIIPSKLGEATYQQATYVLANARVLDAANTRHARNLASATEPNTTYTQPSPDEAQPSILSMDTLACLSGFQLDIGVASSGSMHQTRTMSGQVGAV